MVALFQSVKSIESSNNFGVDLLSRSVKHYPSKATLICLEALYRISEAKDNQVRNVALFDDFLVRLVHFQKTDIV
jgi:hypothetical protein